MFFYIPIDVLPVPLVPYINNNNNKIAIKYILLSITSSTKNTTKKKTKKHIKKGRRNKNQKIAPAMINLVVQLDSFDL